MWIIPNQPAPDFTLPDHSGQPFRLSSRFGAGSTVMVFIRGHWCPYCRRYLGKLSERQCDLADQHAAMWIISPEPQHTSASLANELKLPFPILVDVDGEVIDLYQTRNRLGSFHALLPHPAVVIVDASGQIRFRSIDRDIRRRTTVRTILDVLKRINDASIIA